MPTQQALTPCLVPPELLPRALAHPVVQTLYRNTVAGLDSSMQTSNCQPHRSRAFTLSMALVV